MALAAETPHHKTVPAKERVQPEPSTAYHQVDNTFRLTTPENISFEYQLAGPFRRLFPYLLDLVIITALYMGLAFLVSLVIGLISGLLAYLGVPEVAELLFAISGALVWLGLFLMYWFYGAYFETYYNGRTLGKMVANLRVLSTDGHAIDGTQATLRNLFRLVDLMPMVPLASLLENNDIPQQIGLPTAIFGIIVMSLSPKFQRLGDLVAGTMVVNEEADRDPQIHTFADSRVPQLAELIPSSFYVSNSLSKAVAVYVERREQLGVARSGEIAAKLAGSLTERFGLATDTDADLLICSLYYKVFVGESNPDSELNSHSELNSANKSKLNSKYSNTSRAAVTPPAGASPYERPGSVATPVAMVANPPQASNPSPNSELE